jgi:hypothetical protein
MTSIDTTRVNGPRADQMKIAWQRFVETFEPLRPELYRDCRYLTRDAWDAEDLVQDTLARARVTLGCDHLLLLQPGRRGRRLRGARCAVALEWLPLLAGRNALNDAPIGPGSSGRLRGCHVNSQHLSSRPLHA